VSRAPLGIFGYTLTHGCRCTVSFVHSLGPVPHSKGLPGVVSSIFLHPLLRIFVHGHTFMQLVHGGSEPFPQSRYIRAKLDIVHEWQAVETALQNSILPCQLYLWMQVTAPWTFRTCKLHSEPQPGGYYCTIQPVLHCAFNAGCMPTCRRHGNTPLGRTFCYTIACIMFVVGHSHEIEASGVHRLFQF